MRQSKARQRPLQFRLSVRHVRPEIWRKLLVPSDITLEKLHSVLQVLMGWTGHHLYAFVIDGKRYSPPHEDDGDGRKRNATAARLSTIFGREAKPITYEYDFGDKWEIELRPEPGADGVRLFRQAECVEGSRRGPVENAGGSREYMEKAEIYNNPHHRRYLEVRRFLGPGFDPEAFDLARTNEMLKAVQ
jgi:hypothetical protein